MTAPFPICTSASEHFAQADGKAYFRCDLCEARFLDPGSHPATQDEYSHYLHHENDVNDPRYRKFLSKLATPLLEELPARAKGLDYGCGPGPALAVMLTEAGHAMAIYDPFFADDHEALTTTYDFITCTEVIEHFHDPMREFSRLDAMLRPGGVLGLMTCFQTEDSRFAEWHYRKDPTHVVFYRDSTLRWIARKFGWKIKVPAKDVAIMFKTGTNS